MTEFKQIIGRNKAARADEGKTHFVVMIPGVTRLFADEDWDGEVKSTKDSIPTQRPCRSVRGAVPEPLRRLSRSSTDTAPSKSSASS